MNAAPAAPDPGTTRRQHGRRGPAAGLAAALLGVTLLAACGGAAENASSGTAASQGDTAAGSAADSGGAAAPAAPAEGDAAQSGKASGAGSSTQLSRGVAAAASARLIRTADVSFEVKDLAAAAGRVRAVAARYGGYVGSETTGLNEPTESGTGDGAQRVAQGEATLVLRVVEPKLDAALDDVARQVGGKELSRRSSSSDVTGDIADLQSRVATQRASVARVRALLDKAASIQEVVLLESELTRRESDLEAAQARLAAISDQADLATLTVTLRTPEAVVPTDEPRNGFLTGLDNGWSAVKASTTIVLTLLGALLPVALVAGLLGWPLWLWRNRRSARRPAPAMHPVYPQPEQQPVYAGAPAAPQGPDGPEDPGTPQGPQPQA